MINLEKQFQKIDPKELFASKDQPYDTNQDQAELVTNRYQNQRLYSPSIKKLIQKKDASIMLKDEIGESSLRLKAAKFGHSITEIVPEYDNTFYLPDKDKFRITKAVNQRNRPAMTSMQTKHTVSASVNLPRLQPQSTTSST